MEFISSYLSEYRLPGVPKFTYNGARVASTDAGSSSISEGVVTISASLRTGSGVRVDFDVPVQIRKGAFLDPSIIVVSGVPKVIAQSTFDELSKLGTIYDVKNERPIYSPPSDIPGVRAITRRHSNGSMFDSASLRKMISSRSFQSATILTEEEAMQYEAILQQKLDDLDRVGEPTDAELNMIAAEESESTEKSAQLFDDSLDRAERPGTKAVTGECPLKCAVEVTDRGGATHEFPKGAKVEVIRDHAGDGVNYVVRFETGLVAIVASDCIC
jgi:hypothetical protein